MSNSIETVASSINANYKNVYADKIKDLVPESSVLLRPERVKFVSKKGREGLQYNQPVILSLPSSATWGLGGPTLNAAIAMQMGNAIVAGSAITMRDVIAYDAAARAASSDAAFEAAVGLVVRTLLKSHAKLAEIDLLYGNGSIANVASPVTGGVSLCESTSVASGTSTTCTFTVSYGTWAPAIFSGYENAQLDAYQSGSIINSNAALTITSVNVIPTSSSVGGTVTVSGNATDITALVAANGGNVIDFYWRSAYGNNLIGLKGILSNTGTIFNISAANYSLWQSNSYSAGSSQLTFSKLQQAVALGVSRGLDEAVLALVSPVTFADLVNEQAGARRYDSSYNSSKNENGSEALTYWGPSGKIEVIAHPFVHQGEAFVFPAPELIKVGPLDKIEPALPGMGDLVFQSPLTGSYELRTFSDMGLLLCTPAKATWINNITNSQSA
ncbi:MAG: hypothetical protein KGL39_20050 [Patescibacteria group bacterium]|nr:hypothetical protein [Patescibacteria group bacterium]